MEGEIPTRFFGFLDPQFAVGSLYKLRRRHDWYNCGQTEFQSISTDSEIKFSSRGSSYNIKTDPDGKCNKYWKKAKEWGAPGHKNTGTRHDIEDDIDILIVLDSDKSTENWEMESKDWCYKGFW